jgi:hypothetical protein
MNSLISNFNISTNDLNNSNLFFNTYNFELNNTNNINQTLNNIYDDVTSFVNENINQSQSEPQQNNKYTIKDLNNKFPIMKCLEKIECPICFEKPVKKCRELNCNHIFCYECIDKWFKNNNTCPICKKNIIT